MRVTQNMLTRTLVSSMNSDLDYLQQLNQQLTSGKKINSFSDDVMGAAEILRLSRSNDSYNTYLNHMQTADGVLSVATTSLQQASEALSNIRQLAVQAVTGTANDTSLRPIADALDGQLSGLLDLANVQYNGGYVFSGDALNTIPYQTTKDATGKITDVTYMGGSITTEAPISPSSTTEMNVVGSSAFQANGDLFKTLIALRDAIASGDKDKANALLTDLQTSTTDVQQSLVRLGERQNQLQFTQNATQQIINLNTTTISDEQDADIAEATVKYNIQMAQLQMVMKVAAQAVLPSLIDFLGTSG